MTDLVIDMYSMYSCRITWEKNNLLEDEMTPQKQAYIISIPLKPHFYIVKPGFTGVYIIFLFLLKNIDCGYSLEPLRLGGSNEYPQSMFWAEIWINIRNFIWKLSVIGGEIWIGVFS